MDIDEMKVEVNDLSWKSGRHRKHQYARQSSENENKENCKNVCIF